MNQLLILQPEQLFLILLYSKFKITVSIKTKNRDPKLADFSNNNLVINTKEGSLFYKSEKGLHKYTEQPSYQLHHFANNWTGTLNSSTDPFKEKFIDWTNGAESNQVAYTRQLLMPFNGMIHKLFFKQSGINPTTTIRLYQNIKDQQATPSTATNNSPIKTIIHTNKIGTGDDKEVGSMNVVVFNKKVRAGDHIAITMQAESDGIDEIFGQLLTSQDITI